MKIWVAVKYFEPPKVWEVVGVFSSESKAVEACGEDREIGIGPLELDEKQPEETRPWPDFYYPNISGDREKAVKS